MYAQLLHSEMRTATVYSAPLLQEICRSSLTTQDYDMLSKDVEVHDIPYVAYNKSSPTLREWL